MKQSVFLSSVIVITAVVAVCIYWFVLGNPSNFRNGETRTLSNNLLGTVYTLVAREEHEGFTFEDYMKREEKEEGRGKKEDTETLSNAELISIGAQRCRPLSCFPSSLFLLPFFICICRSVPSPS